uniref:PPM-type phosphatase domain-containing protein n=1 Tax=Macrostomum lignano TaxID=282301 RepID=A0A1I8IY57_9PLAT
YHRLLVSFGNRVEWQLYFKSEELLQRRVRDLIGSLTLALLENSDSAAPEIETRIGTAITSILVESLTGLINRFSRKWRMTIRKASPLCDQTTSERQSNCAASCTCPALSFLAPMLRPNPEYSSTAQAPDSNPKRSVALVAAATVEISSAMSPAADRGNAGNSGASGASAGGALQQGRSAPRLSLETQNVAWPSQQIWADEQAAWQSCRHLKMFEAPSLIGGPCTGRLGRFCLDRRCSRSEQRDSVERWMFVGDTYIGLLNMESNEIEEVMLFDAEFHVLTGKDSKQLGTCGMKLINNFCQLHVAFQREVDSRVLARAISLAMSGDPSWNWDDAPMASIVSTEAGGSSVLGEAPPTASNGFLFSRRLSLIRSTQNSLLSSASVGGGAGVRISKNDPVSDSAAMEEQALAAAFAVAAASTATGRNANNATVDHRSTELTAMMMAATGETTDGSENSFYAGQRHQQQLLRQQRRKRRKKQREARQSGASIIGRGQERSERQRQNELEQQQLQSDLDLEVPVHSFAPPRSATKAQWYVDAGSYFYAVADAIDMAQAEIFVCGSVLAPEVYLKRPDPDGRYQLGRLLIEKAKLRVQVFILLDNPNCLKDTNACLHVLDYFEGVPNVHIMLSPFDLDDASNEFFKPALGLMKAFLVMRRRLYNRCFGRFFPGIGATASGGSGSSKMVGFLLN